MTVESVRLVKERHEASLLAIPGVVGVGLSGDRIIVYITSPDVVGRIPTVLEGVPILTVVTGPVRRLG